MPIVVNTPQATQQVASVDWADVTNKPSTFPAAPHGPTHNDNNIDPVPNVTETASGLVPKLPPGSPTTKYLAGNGNWRDMPNLVTPTSMGLVPALPSDPTLFLCGAGPTPTYAKVDFNSLSNKPATYPSDWNTTTNKPATFPSDWNTTANKPSTFPTAAHGSTHAGNGTDPVPVVTTAADGLAPRLSGQAGTFLNGMGAYTVPQGAGDMLRAVYDTNGDNIVDHASLADGAPWTGITGKPAAFNPTTHAATHNLGGSDPIAPDWSQIQNKPATIPPGLHASTHLDNGVDPIPVVTTARTGLAPKLSGTATTYLDGSGAFSVPAGTGDMRKSVYDTNGDNIVDHAALADAAPWIGISGKPSTFNPSAHATTHISGGSDTIPNASGSASGLLKPITGRATDFLDGTHSWQDLGSAIGPVVVGSPTPVAALPNAVVIPSFVGTADGPISSPSQYDDHFDGTTLNAKWTENITSGLTATAIALTYSQLALFAASPGSAGPYNHTVSQPIAVPASGTFRITAKINSSLRPSLGAGAGNLSQTTTYLHLGKTGGAGTIRVGIYHNYLSDGVVGGANGTNLAKWQVAGGNGAATTFIQNLMTATFFQYFRIIYNVDRSCTVQVSIDGINWRGLFAATAAQCGFSASVIPDLVFIGMLVTFAGAAELLCDWFRFEAL